MSIVPGYWFGETPPEGVKAAWGCRAILTHYRGNQNVDIVWDRKQSTPDPLPADFSKWLNDNLSRWLNPTPRQRKVPKIGYVDRSSDEVFTYDDGKFHAKACAKRSYGYLYVCAWTE